MDDPVQQRFVDLFGPEFGHGKPFDLARLRAALHQLGDPQNKLPPVIHVAGTNGKGSTIAFMRTLAQAAGLRAHAFSKPHLFLLSERYGFADGTVRMEDRLIGAAERVAAVDSGLTQFDAQVAVAFILFSEEPADLVLLETGMGGRDDSTNVIERPIASVITPIGLDHQDALGTTIAEIAAHKAGILKHGAQAVIARQPDEAREIIDAEAERVGAPLFRCGVEWDAFEQMGRLVVQTHDRLMEFSPPGILRGAHQFDNAGLAVAALSACGLLPNDLGRVARATATAHVYAMGRLYPLTGKVVEAVRQVGGSVMIDGGHNAHAAAALARWFTNPPKLPLPNAEVIERRFPQLTRVAIVGMRARKDANGFLNAFVGAVDKVFTVPLSEAHIPPTELAATARKLGLDATPVPSLTTAIKNAARLPAPRVLICGSFLLVADAMNLAAESV